MGHRSILAGILVFCSLVGNAKPQQTPHTTPTISAVRLPCGLATMAPTRSSLVAHPSSVTFPISPTIPSPQAVHLSSASRLDPPLRVSVMDSTELRVSAPRLTSARSATLSIYPISSGVNGSTTVTVTDAANVSATIKACQEVCGRPDNLFGPPGSQLIYPRAGSMHVPTTIGTLYFSVVSNVAPSGYLHLIAAQNDAVEGGPLQPATPPPGATGVTSSPGPVLTYMSATVPMLHAGKTYRTQIYDDACQPPVLTGRFST